jgi:hypothetical protein
MFVTRRRSRNLSKAAQDGGRVRQGQEQVKGSLSRDPCSVAISIGAASFARAASGSGNFKPEGVQVMSKTILAIIATALVTPVWAAGHGAGAGGMHAGMAGGSGHGATVSAAAHAARQGGMPVGTSVRAVARANSQGPVHANANAIAHVQNSKGRANLNSVLGTGGTTSTSTQAGTTMPLSATSTSTKVSASTKSGKGRKSRIH